MFRYIALVWNSLDPEAVETASLLTRQLRSDTLPWQKALDREGMRVFVADSSRRETRTCTLARGQGVVLGTVFPSIAEGSHVRRLSAFDERESTRIIVSSGRHLIESYWGSYVAILVDTTDDTKWVLRSPAGEMDCLTIQFRKVHLFVSSLLDCSALDSLRFSTNWEYVQTDLCTPIYEHHATGLNEVSRVVHGECVELHQGRLSKSYYWNPFDVAAAFSHDDIEIAGTKLRDATAGCVHAWASCHESLLEMLSGGLDSSIILGLLHSAPSRPQITCLNARNPYDLGTDERTYARLAANGTRCRLVEYERDPMVRLNPSLEAPKTVSPLGDLFMYEPDEVFVKTIEESKATAIVSGAGGDELFYQHGVKFVWIDYLRRKGPGLKAWRIAMNVARLESESIWRVLATSLRDSPTSLVLRDLAKEHSLMNPDVFQQVADNQLFLHPWFKRSNATAPGKRWHIMGLAGALAQDMYRGQDPRANTIENLAPLMSQPLIELCLQIPTYLLCSGKRDRTLARHAFARDVPAAILNRCTKGLTYELGKAILQQNLPVVREALLDGLLVKRGILNRRRLELSLSGQSTSDSGHATHILTYLATEAWLTAWSQGEARVAA